MDYVTNHLDSVRAQKGTRWVLYRKILEVFCKGNIGVGNVQFFTDGMAMIFYGPF